MQALSTIKFTETVLFDEGGYESYLYRSEDFDGEYSSERACMIALLTKMGYCPDILDECNIQTLEFILLTKDIYIEFEN